MRLPRVQIRFTIQWINVTLPRFRYGLRAQMLFVLIVAVLIASALSLRSYWFDGPGRTLTIIGYHTPGPHYRNADIRRPASAATWKRIEAELKAKNVKYRVDNWPAGWVRVP